MAYAIGIDLGTSGLKAVLIDDQGYTVATATTNYPLLKPQPTWREQDPQQWWQALCRATKQVLAGISNSEVRGVAVSGQINGAVFVSEKGQLLRTALIWLDQRAQAECDEVNEQVGDLLRQRALVHLNPVITLGKVLWLRRHQTDLYEKARLLAPKDWLNFNLSGELKAEMSDASTTGAFDLYERCWSSDIQQQLDLRPELFLPLIESHKQLGQVLPDAATASGLAAGTPVFAGGGDMPCMVLGSGAVKPGIVSVGIGTAGHATTSADSMDDRAYNQLWPMCHTLPGKYAWLGCTFTGGASLTWFRDLFGSTYEQLIQEAQDVPQGAEELVYMPWLEGTGTPYPDARARAGFLGLSMRHTRGHMVRALMEGVVFDLRHSLVCFQNLGLPIEEIRLGEGGSRSVLWRQILADVFMQDLQLIETEDLSATGAAILAAVGGNVFPDFESACEAVIRIGETVYPDSGASACYQEAYERYCTLYPTLRSWYSQEEYRN